MSFESKISSDLVKNLVDAHSDLQLGCYFNTKERLVSGVVCTSKWIDDFYWNLYASFGGVLDSRLMDSVSDTMKQKDRNPAYYLDPTNASEQNLEVIGNAGFELDHEIWMAAYSTPSTREAGGIEIKDDAPNFEADFLKTFSLAFGGEATEADGYGDIPPEYLSALKESLNRSPSEVVEHKHFVAYRDDMPVGCGSVHVGSDFAGLYNVGTVPAARGVGIGSTVSAVAIKYALDKGAPLVFFQTQPGGSVQQFYEGLGCSVIFEAAIAHQQS